jgi:predicted metal-dependent HD superfamily phosphohydrolase
MFNFKLENPFDSFRRVLERVPVSGVVRRELQARYTQLNRPYHGLYHLATMWDLHQYFTPPFDHIGPFMRWESTQQTIASAIVFHDAVYDTERNDNEEQSALLWMSAGHDQTIVDPRWVHDTIIATKHPLADRPIHDELREYFVGLDLAWLAAPYELFQLMARLIRLEYPHYSDAEWKSHGVFVTTLLDAPVIFKDTRLRAEFEDAVKANLRRHLSELA